MGIATDVKEALIEVGDITTIIRDSGNVTGKYVKYDLNAQVTKPFIREYFLEITLPYDYPGVSGDIIQIDVTDLRYILMSRTPKTFENEIIYYSGVMYKCNAQADIKRPSEDDWSTQTYHRVTSWENVKSDVYSLIADPLFGTNIETDEELGVFGISKNEFYIPSSIGIRENDRVMISKDEYYRIRSVLKYRFDGVDVCTVDEDSRPACSTTTTTTTTSSTTTTSPP